MFDVITLKICISKIFCKGPIAKADTDENRYPVSFQFYIFGYVHILSTFSKKVY